MKGGQNVWEIKLRLAPSHKGEFEKVGDKPRAPKRGPKNIFQKCFKIFAKNFEKVFVALCLRRVW